MDLSSTSSTWLLAMGGGCSGCWENKEKKGRVSWGLGRGQWVSLSPLHSAILRCSGMQWAKPRPVLPELSAASPNINHG